MCISIKLNSTHQFFLFKLFLSRDFWNKVLSCLHQFSSFHIFSWVMMESGLIMWRRFLVISILLIYAFIQFISLNSLYFGRQFFSQDFSHVFMCFINFLLYFWEISVKEVDDLWIFTSFSISFCFSLRFFKQGLNMLFTFSLIQSIFFLMMEPASLIISKFNSIH